MSVFSWVDFLTRARKPQASLLQARWYHTGMRRYDSSPVVQTKVSFYSLSQWRHTLAWNKEHGWKLCWDKQNFSVGTFLAKQAKVIVFWVHHTHCIYVVKSQGCSNSSEECLKISAPTPVPDQSLWDNRGAAVRWSRKPSCATSEVVQNVCTANST